MTIRQIKRAIRRDVIARVLGLDAADRVRQESALASLFPTMLGLDGAETVLLYVAAFPEEFDTGPMLRSVLATGKRLVCPRVNRAETRLDLFEIADPDRDFEPGALGIPEPRTTNPIVAPSEVDWVLVPGVAYDGRKHRIGRGAGHYDRLLPTLRAEVPRWALAFDEQWVEAIPDQPHDQPLDGVVSPGRSA